MSLTKSNQSRESKPQTELQALASKENFALFILQGMQSNLVHMYDLARLTKDRELRIDIEDIRVKLIKAQSKIRIKQIERKLNKIKSKGSE